MKKRVFFPIVILMLIGTVLFSEEIGDLDKVVESNNAFCMDLYKQMKQFEGNLFYSPYSVFSALAMTYEGAKDKTAEEMQKVMHLPEDRDQLRKGFLALQKEINKEDKSYILNTANALWTQKKYPFVEEYIKRIDRYYQGKATALDFATQTEASRKTINNWVEEKTNDKIKDLIPAGMLNDMTRMVLTNAIYFKGDWAVQFDKSATSEGTFKLDSSRSIATEMMNETANFQYGETDDVQLLEMNYKGYDLSMLVILPVKNDITPIENMLSKKKLQEWKSGMYNTKVIVEFPKFSFKTKYFMNDILVELGMKTAFDYPAADFTGMSPTDELFISDVVHQTFLEVAEYGTEAAAATAVAMKAGSARMISEPKIFKADHPFLFLIQQRQTGNILFIGRLNDPGKI